MKTRVTQSAAEPSEAEIQHAAYLLWIESGKLPGHDLENWFAAKELLKHHHGRFAGDRRHAASAAAPGSDRPLDLPATLHN